MAKPLCKQLLETQADLPLRKGSNFWATNNQEPALGHQRQERFVTYKYP